MYSRIACQLSLLTNCFFEDICWPPDTTLVGSLQTSSDASYCSSGSSCSDDIGNVGEGPKCTIECPNSAWGGCCVTGLTCASDSCIDHGYSTSAGFRVLPAENSASSISQGLYDCIILAFIGPVQRETLPSIFSTDRALPTSASQCSQPENVSQEGQDLPISDTNLGNPTAWRAKVGEIAVRNQAEGNWDGKDRKRRLRRLGRLIIGLLVVILVMWLF